MGPTESVWRERGLREAVLAGDEIAWRRWYDESYAPLHAYLVWRSGGMRDHADELAQEVWLTAVRKLSSFDPARGSFLAWLRGLGLEQYAPAFRDNDVDGEVLRRQVGPKRHILFG